MNQYLKICMFIPCKYQYNPLWQTCQHRHLWQKMTTQSSLIENVLTRWWVLRNWPLQTAAVKCGCIIINVWWPYFNCCITKLPRLVRLIFGHNCKLKICTAIWSITVQWLDDKDIAGDGIYAKELVGGLSSISLERVSNLIWSIFISICCFDLYRHHKY